MTFPTRLHIMVIDNFVDYLYMGNRLIEYGSCLRASMFPQKIMRGRYLTHVKRNFAASGNSYRRAGRTQGRGGAVSWVRGRPAAPETRVEG